MLEQAALRHWRSHIRYGMLDARCRRERARKIRRAAAARAPPATSSATSAAQSFRRFGFVQSSIVSRWAEIVGERYAQGLVPRIDQVPDGQEGRRSADPAGRRRACAADPASDADDRRAGQSLLRLCRDQPHRVPAGQAAGTRRPGRSGRSSARCPRSWAKACAKSPIPSCAPCLELLAAQIAASSGPPSLVRTRRRPDTRDQPEQLNR